MALSVDGLEARRVAVDVCSKVFIGESVRRSV